MKTPLSYWVFYWLGSRVGDKEGENRGGGSDVDWQSLTQSSPSEDRTAARRVWLMVTDGDCWPRPCLPIVQRPSRDSLIDSGATPFIPPSSTGYQCLRFNLIQLWLERSFSLRVSHLTPTGALLILKGIHEVQWQFNSTANEIPRVRFTVHHPLSRYIPSINEVDVDHLQSAIVVLAFFIVMSSKTSHNCSFNSYRHLWISDWCCSMLKLLLEPSPLIGWQDMHRMSWNSTLELWRHITQNHKWQPHGVFRRKVCMISFSGDHDCRTKLLQFIQ